MGAYAVEGINLEELKQTAEIIERRTSYWSEMKKPMGLILRYKEMVRGLKEMEKVFENIRYTPITEEDQARKVLQICMDIRPYLEKISVEAFWPLRRKAKHALYQLNKVIESLEISFDEELIEYTNEVDR